MNQDGKIASPAKRLSAKKKGELFPTLAPAGDGRFWSIWEEEIDKGAIDLMARALVRLGERCAANGFANRQRVAIRPRELVFVEHAGTVGHVLEAEAARELLGGQQLVVLAW